MNLGKQLREKFKERTYDECLGGLRVKLQPSPFYPPINDKEEIEGRLENCLTTNDCDDVIYEMENRRRYHRLIQTPYLIHYPSTWYPSAAFGSRQVNYLWKRYTVFSLPDDAAITQMNAMLGSTLVRIEAGYEFVQLDTFSFCLMPIWKMYTTIKRRLFIAIARLLRCQKEMRNVILENTYLRGEDGFRLLLTIALTVAPQLEHFHMAHFFRRGIFCSKLWNEEKQHLNKETDKREIWARINESYLDLPGPYILYYKTLLNSLSNLVVLHLCYTYLAFGNGWVLKELECIKRGTLKQLHILISQSDTVYNSEIPGLLWLDALEMCPNLTVRLYMMNLAEYDSMKMIFVAGMPLHSLHLATGSMFIDYQNILTKGGQLHVGCTLKTIIYRYVNSIRVLSLEVGRVTERLDVILCRCLTDLHYLKEFYFSGTMDKLDTLKEICNYLLNFNTRLKVVKLRLEEDPCSPVELQEAVAKVNAEYASQITAKDIIFKLETYKF